MDQMPLIVVQLRASSSQNSSGEWPAKFPRLRLHQAGRSEDRNEPPAPVAESLLRGPGCGGSGVGHLHSVRISFPVLGFPLP